MNNIKAIFVDIDNTIFDHLKKHKYDERSIKALNNLYDKGVKIIICSARPIYSLREFGVLNRIKYSGVIASNGAVRVYNNEWFDKYVFPKKELKEIVDVCKKHKLCIELVTFDDRFYVTQKTKEVDYHHKIFFEIDAKFEQYNFQEVISMLLFADRSVDPILNKEMPKTIHMFRFSEYGLDVLSKSHSKGEAVISMLNKMGINKEEALAFGDDYQDISMFEQVGTGVALGNAKDELKNIAQFVTKPVYHHGVYKFIKKAKLLR
ncbi:MAG: HAD family hydrolase [Bacilli bacterium]|nr:HAD family hydrolase [Bacilli bacterium]